MGSLLLVSKGGCNLAEEGTSLWKQWPEQGRQEGAVLSPCAEGIYPGLASWDSSGHLPMLPAPHLSLVPKLLSCLPPEVEGERGVTSTHSGHSLHRIPLRIVSVCIEIMPHTLYPVLSLTVLMPSPCLSCAGPRQTYVVSEASSGSQCGLALIKVSANVG